MRWSRAGGCSCWSPWTHARPCCIRAGRFEQFRALATDFTWWKANLATLRAWLRTAGFAPEGRPLLLLPRGHAGMDRVPTVALTARRPVSSI